MSIISLHFRSSLWNDLVILGFRLAYFKAAFKLFEADYYVKADDDIYLRPGLENLLIWEFVLVLSILALILFVAC